MPPESRVDSEVLIPDVGPPWIEMDRTTAGGPISAGYCLWEFDGRSWVLKSDRCRQGYVPSAPPAIPGRFRGQLRAVMAVPAPAAPGA